MQDSNLYSILHVEPAATEEAIKQAYRKLAKTTHPDLNPGNAEAELRFRLINEAYQTLQNSEKRQAYDVFLAATRRRREFQTGQPADEPADLISALAREWNILLWDLEDVLSSPAYHPMESLRNGLERWRYITVVLAHFEYWFLGEKSYLDRYNSGELENTVGLKNYFYYLRKELDRIFRILDTETLNASLPQLDCRRVDLWFELMNLTIFYLDLLKKGEKDYIGQKYAFAYPRAEIFKAD